MIDLNKCPNCKDDVVIGESGTIGCVNNNCSNEIIGIIYNKSLPFQKQADIFKLNQRVKCAGTEYYFKERNTGKILLSNHKNINTDDYNDWWVDEERVHP